MEEKFLFVTGGRTAARNGTQSIAHDHMSQARTPCGPTDSHHFSPNGYEDPNPIQAQWYSPNAAFQSQGHPSGAKQQHPNLSIVSNESSSNNSLPQAQPLMSIKTMPPFPALPVNLLQNLLSHMLMTTQINNNNGLVNPQSCYP